MRYESFYPFSSNQSPPVAMRQTIPYGPQPIQNYDMPQRQFYGAPTGNQFGPPSQNAGQKNTNKMEMYMQTANQFLNTAQQFAPLVQQMAPMVQNLPAMWRLYKGFQSLPNAGATPASGTPSNASAVGAALSNLAGGSSPRIFQPPN